MKRIRLILIPVLLIALTFDSLAQSASFTPGETLQEISLDSLYVDLVLVNDTFTDNANLHKDTFRFVNAPAGLTIQYLSDRAETSVRIHLAFDYTDFDTDYTDFKIAITPHALQESTDTLFTSAGTVYAGIESAYLTPDARLEEYDLDSRSVTFTLVNDIFDDLPLGDSDFSLDNIPSGLTVESHTETATSMTINLAWDDTDNDIDTDFTNFRVTITDETEFLITSADLQTSTADTIFADIERATITPSSTLDEYNPDLNAQYLDIVIVKDNLTTSNTTTILNNIDLLNAPPGVTKQSVNYTDNQHIRLNLNYDDSDFDTDSTNFHIQIDGNIMQRTLDADELYSDSVTVTAYDENPSATFTPDQPLNEVGLEDRIIYVKLIDCDFSSSPSKTDITISGYPPGVDYTVSDGTPGDSIYNVNIDFDDTDFDTDYTNFKVTVVGTNLVTKETVTSIVSNAMTIEAFDEPPAAYLTSNQSPLREDNINGAYIYVNLDQETFTTDTFTISEFDIVNEPPGVTMTGFSYVNNTQVRLTLSFDGSDFDADITDFRVDIDPFYLTRSTSTLPSADYTIEAIKEPAVATFSPDATMEEYSLQDRSLSITIEQDTFLTLGTLTPVGNYFELDNAPTGLVIESVNVLNKNQATLELDFTYNDFDANVTNFGVIVKAGNLMQSTLDVETTNDETIYHYLENPVAEATEDSRLVEFTIEDRSVSIHLTDEWFPTPGSVQTTNFTLLNEPDGLEVESIASISKYDVTLNLQFDDTDFDIHYNNFRISIDNLVLIQSGSPLVTDAMSIDPTHEPEITSVTIVDQVYKVGDVVTATIALDVPTDLDTMFTLVDGSLGVYDLGNLTRDGSDKSVYYASFTVPEDGTDYAADADIPVSDLQLKDGVIFGNTWNTPISQSNDLLDANTPDVSSILMISSGFQKVGDKVFMVVSADDKGYSIDNATQINGVSISEDNVNYTDNNNNTYTFDYTVRNGEQDVPVPGDLTAGFVFSDVAGNKNDPFTTISTNDVSIDANPPIVDSIKITSTDAELIITDILIITIYADDAGYTFEEGSTIINDVAATAGNIVTTELGGGQYTITYEVEEGDTEIENPGDLAVEIVMTDQVGNTSDPVTNLKNNNVLVSTTRPVVSLSGTQQICVGDTATLYLNLEGILPWDIIYYNETFDDYDTITGITESLFEFEVVPPGVGSNTYKITKVIDATGNDNIGTGTAFVQVNELPVVSIVDLASLFSVFEDPVSLTGDPYHITRGVFNGPGVNQDAPGEYTFDPGEAGVSSAHKIYYTFEDINGCVSSDSATVTVLSASATIYIGPDPLQGDIRSMACWYEDEFLISAQNTADSIGYFTATIGGEFVPGLLQNNYDNTATLNPSAIDWNTIQDDQVIDITYYFKDKLGVELPESRSLSVIYFQTPKITGLEETEYCSNEPIFPLEGNYNVTDPKTGTFTIVQGVGGSIAEGYTFNPATANLGKTWIRYTQQQTAECVLKDSVELTVHPSPMADFEILDTCIAKTGSWVRFSNTTDIETLGLQMESWAWDFGDFFNNFSSAKDTSHFYSVGGSRTVSLKATTIHGCTHTKEQVFTFGAEPLADFEWNTECFTGDDIEFTALEESDDPVDLYKWRIYNPDGTLLHSESGSDLTEFDYNFASRDEYPVEFTVETNRHCRDTITDTILLRPYLYVKATQDPYFEDFEADPPGWYSSKDEINQWGSWTFDPVTTGTFPGTAASGDHAWYTVHAHSDSIEQSWVSSPCFNLRETRRPMIRMSVKRSMERDRDGAVLQYTADHGQTWNNVGALDDGSINWFNSFRITPEPGGQAEGWTGDFTFTADKNWVIAKHELDALRQYPVIQFRIGYGSYGISDVVNNKGFAFDDIWIGERSRLVLLEHFTNAGDNLSTQSNAQVNNLVDENNMDIIDIKYHTGEPGPDKMYDDYPIGPSARSLYYGISTFPQSFMDGGGVTGTYRYNYKGTDLDELDLFTRALTDPSFDITLDATVSGGQVNVEVTVEALEDLPEASYTVHIAVIEKLISDAGYAGGSGQTEFQNVVKQMLPDAGGSIFTKSWTTGDQETVSASWSFENVINEEMIYVVAFVQNRETKEVYQAQTNDPDANATSIESFMAAIDEDILVYPNPSTDRAFIAFGKPVEDRTELKVYNHAGALLEIHRIEGGLNVYELNVADYKKGVYYLRVTDKQKIVGTAKLIVL